MRLNLCEFGRPTVNMSKKIAEGKNSWTTSVAFWWVPLKTIPDRVCLRWRFDFINNENGMW